jgi:hypothetical protein
MPVLNQPQASFIESPDEQAQISKFRRKGPRGASFRSQPSVLA